MNDQMPIRRNRFRYTKLADGREIYLDEQHIVYFEEDRDASGTWLVLTNNERLKVNEYHKNLWDRFDDEEANR